MAAAYSMLDYQKNIFFVSVPFFLTQYEFSGEQIVWDCNETTIDENSIKSLFIFTTQMLFDVVPILHSRN